MSYFPCHCPWIRFIGVGLLTGAVTHFRGCILRRKLSTWSTEVSGGHSLHRLRSPWRPSPKWDSLVHRGFFRGRSAQEGSSSHKWKDTFEGALETGTARLCCYDATDPKGCKGCSPWIGDTSILMRPLGAPEEILKLNEKVISPVLNPASEVQHIHMIHIWIQADMKWLQNSADSLKFVELSLCKNQI